MGPRDGWTDAPDSGAFRTPLILRKRALARGNRTLYLNYTGHGSNGELSIQGSDRFAEFRIECVTERFRCQPLNLAGRPQQHHACVALVGDLQSRSPQVMISVHEKGPILEGRRHFIFDSGDGHGSKQSGHRLKKNDGVDWQMQTVLFEALNPQLCISSIRAAHGKDDHHRTTAES